MFEMKRIICPECSEAVEVMPATRCGEREVHRREFLKTVGKAALAVTAAPLLNFIPLVEARGPNEKAEQMVKNLYESLTTGQKKTVVLPWGDARRLRVANNWRVIPQRIAEIYSQAQQEMIDKILRDVTSEEGYEKIMRAMQDDWEGLDNYSACLFSDGGENLAFLLTGRHQTIRADGGTEQNAVFGGPIFYGHAVTFNERPDHPGNVWWHQARLASQVFRALDGKQRERALVLEGSPDDAPSSVRLQGPSGQFTGIPVSELSGDQKELVEDVMRALLAPYRASDVEEVIAAIKANGGLDQLHITFYQDGDLPDKEGIWERWKIEGPALAWYFRGSPHVHTWIHIAHNAG